MKKVTLLSLFFTTLFAQWPTPMGSDDLSEGYALYSEGGISMRATTFVDRNLVEETGLSDYVLLSKVKMMFRRNGIVLDQENGELFLNIEINALYDEGLKSFSYSVNMSVLRALLTMSEEAPVPGVVWSNHYIATAPEKEAREQVLQIVEDLVDQVSAAAIEHN